MKNVIVLSAVLWALTASGALAGDVASSASYRLTAAAMVGGGGYAESTGYSAWGGIGQSGPVGVVGGPHYVLRAGFYFLVPWEPSAVVPIGALELLLLNHAP